MPDDVNFWWNVALSIGTGLGGFLGWRVVDSLDKLRASDVKLTESDAALAKEINGMTSKFVTRDEIDKLVDRLEKRFESQSFMISESNKTLFHKLDIITEKISEKVSRSELAGNCPHKQ